jgi:hypothetical protein
MGGLPRDVTGKHEKQYFVGWKVSKISGAIHFFPRIGYLHFLWLKQLFVGGREVTKPKIITNF